MRPPRPLPTCLRAAVACAGLAVAAILTPPRAAAADEAWPVAGQQGLVQFVIVPEAAARDREAYARQLARLCEPERTCFVNFYTNRGGAPVTLPLPPAIEQEATAVFRRSAKNGAERLSFACRLQLGEPCF